MKFAKTYHAFLKHKKSSFKRQILFICCVITSFFETRVANLNRFCSRSQNCALSIVTWHNENAFVERIDHFFCNVKNAMRNFKKREIKTSFIVTTFSIDFLFMMLFSTRTKISFFFLCYALTKLINLFFSREFSRCSHC